MKGRSLLAKPLVPVAGLSKYPCGDARLVVLIQDSKGGSFGGVGFGVEVFADALGGGGVDDGGEGVGAGLPDAADAAEVFEQALAGAGADAGDGERVRSRGRASRGACGGR